MLLSKANNLKIAKALKTNLLIVTTPYSKPDNPNTANVSIDKDRITSVNTVYSMFIVVAVAAGPFCDHRSELAFHKNAKECICNRQSYWQNKL